MEHVPFVIVNVHSCLVFSERLHILIIDTGFD